MAKYKNTKTGAIIEIASTLSGGNWVKITEDITKEDIEEIIEGTEEETEDITKEDIEEIIEGKKTGIDGITAKEIKQELDAFGIEYNPKAKKQELYDLMMQGR